MTAGAMRPAVAAELGRRIRELRTGLGLTVEALAERSSLSRRMLTQIELGQANPSVATVDRVATGLGTSFADLLGVSRHNPPHGVEVWSSGTGSWGYLLSAVETPQTSVELWKWCLAGPDRYEGAPDSPSPESIVHVLDGGLLVTRDGIDAVVPAGESLRVPGGSGHAFRSASEEPTVFIRVVPFPKLTGPS